MRPGQRFGTATPPTRDLARIRLVYPEDRAGELGPPGADDAGDAHDLGPRGIRMSISSSLPFAERPFSSRTTSPGTTADLRRKKRIEFLADHHLHELVHALELADRDRPHGRAVPEHADPIADLEDLIQLVRDIDDAHALRV